MYHLVILAVLLTQGGDISSYRKINFEQDYATIEACTIDIRTALSRVREAFPEELVVAVICEDLAQVQMAAALYLQKRIEKTEHTLGAD